MIGRVGLLCLLMLPTPSHALESWYSDGTSRCSGTTSVAEAINTKLPPNLEVFSIGSSGNFAYRLGASKYKDVISNKSITLQTYTLTSHDSIVFRGIFKKAGDATVPLFFKVGMTLLADISLTSALANLGAGFLFDEAYKELDASAGSYSLASNFVAESGKFVRKASVATRGNERYLVVSSLYEVNVGQEFRSFLVYSCIAPLALNVSEFSTQSPLNNKIVKPRSGNVWGVWDITDNRWSNDNLIFTREGENYYEFTKDEIENGNVVGKTTVRISTTGGPWQRKASYDAAFMTLYGNVTAQ